MHGSWREVEDATLERVRAKEGVPPPAVSASASLDGVMISMRTGEGGRDASCAAPSFRDRDGGRLSPVCIGRMPEEGKAGLKARLWKEVEAARAMRPDLALVAVADSSPDNWSFLSKLDPEAEAVDFRRACEQFAAVAGERRDRADLEREPDFFRKNRSRMRDRELRERKLPIGSVIAEAANKTLVACRMKGSGVRRSMAGGHAVPAFGALIKSGRFDGAWEAMAANDNLAAALQPLAA
ncbi:MAG: hypothetical protein OXI01_07510 [Albidovulum sp.]|nr:hypothetical protein [Albidovulum sp.]